MSGWQDLSLTYLDFFDNAYSSVCKPTYCRAVLMPSEIFDNVDSKVLYSNGLNNANQGKLRINSDKTTFASPWPRDFELRCLMIGPPIPWSDLANWPSGPTFTVNVHNCQTDVVGSSSLSSVAVRY